MKQTALVICPGRGTYNKSELGYLKHHHSDKGGFVGELDQLRTKAGQVPISELDGSDTFRANIHTTGDNASLLIYACALADFADINREAFDIIAVTGNSMGWYLALACSSALSLENAGQVVNTMGTMMHEIGVGGQVVYPLVDDQWRIDTKNLKVVEETLDEATASGHMVSISIDLGGIIVFAGDEPGIEFLMDKLPDLDRFPMRLANHAAFHSPLLDHVSARALAEMSRKLFQPNHIPMIDGRGHVWSPYATDLEALHAYTFGHQITQIYDFSSAVEVGIKEFAPDRIIVLGPGSTLGAPVAQELVKHQWCGLSCKDDFIERQKTDPLILSMGMGDQRDIVCKSRR